MKKINLAITGCLGKMGQQLIRSSKDEKNFKLVAVTENRMVNKKIAGIIPPPTSPVFEKNLCVYFILFSFKRGGW